MQYYKLEAIVLKKKVLRENDVAVTVYSKQKGKLNLVLRGGKNIISKMAGHVEPVSLVELNVVTTRGDKDQIIGAQLKKSFSVIVQDINKFGYANYFLEVVDMMTREGDGDEKIFDLLLKALNRVLETRVLKDLPLIRVLFVFKLLYLLGFEPKGGDGNMDKLVKDLVRGKVDVLMNDKGIMENQKKLFIISQQSLNAQLDRPLKSEDFIKEVGYEPEKI